MKRIVTIIALLLACALMQAQGLEGTWHGRGKVGQVELGIVFHLGRESSMDSPDQGAYGIPAVVDSSYNMGLKVAVPSLGAVFTGVPFKGKISGTLTQMGVSIPLTLEPGDFVYARPQTPQPPYPYATGEVSFAGADAVLAGTLAGPAPGAKGTAVLFVSGSGQQDRDESLFGHKPFAVLADALAREGIASLRYDDRGFGASTGDAENATTLTLSEDAAAGVAYLRSLGYGKVGVIGHSEGGTIAMMLAAGEKAPDFIVSLAGMADRGDSTIFRQVVKTLTLGGADLQQAEAYAAQALSANAAAGQPWMDYFLKLDPAACLPLIKCPFLALNGEKDCQVLPEYNLSKIKALCPSADARLYPGLNHLFQHCGTGLATEYNRIEETISPEVIEDITGWVKGL